MRYLGRILNPSDYVFLLFSVFFDASGFPTPESTERRKSLILTVQALVLVLAVNLISAAIARWSGLLVDWKNR